MQTKYFDQILIFFMALIALFSAYQLFLPIDIYKSDSSEAVAEIISQVNTVKTKRNKWIAWIDSAIGLKLSDQELIYTHAESSADLVLTDGSEINLAENTLFKVTGNKDQESMTLEQGVVFAKLSHSRKDLNLNIGGHPLKLSANEAEFQISRENDEENISILSGEMKIQNESGVQVLKENQQALLNGNQVSIITIPMIKLAPHKSEFYAAKEWKVKFSWKNNSKTSESFLEISKDRKFSDKLSFNVSDLHTMSVDFESEGQYYWRIVGMDINENTFKTPIRFFRLIQERPPIILSPPENETLYIFDEELKSLTFLWSGQNFKQFQLEIQDENSFTPIEVRKNNFQASKLKPGKYQIRVRGIDSTRPESIWSDMRLFEIKRIEKLLQPVLELPLNNSEKIFYSEEVKTLFKWSNVLGAEQYIIEIKTPNSLESFSTTSPNFLWTTNIDGAIQWRIVAKNALQTSESPWSELRLIKSFEMNLTPGQGSKIELKRPDQEVTFEWEADSQGESTYLLEVSEDPSFNQIQLVKEETSKQSQVKFSKTGTYYWRTKILGKKGETKFSRPVQIEVVPAPPPEPLKLPETKEIEIKFENKSSFWDFIISPAFASDAYADISWPKNEEAKFYVLEIYKDPDLKQKVLSEQVKENNFRWSNPTEGEFFWRVAIVDFWGRQNNFSNLSKLILSYPDSYFMPSEVELDVPKHRSSSSALQKFSWKADPKAISYELLIASDLEFNNVVFRKSLIENSTVIDPAVTNLPQNQRLFWKVIVIGKLNQKNSSLRRQFTFTRPQERKNDINLAEKKSKKQLPKIQEKRERDEWYLLASPSKINQEVTSTRTTTIDGTAINSLRFGMDRQAEMKWMNNYNVEFQRVSGEVFNGKAFSHLQFSFRPRFNTSLSKFNFQFIYGAQVLMTKVHPYQSTVLEESATLFSLPIGVRKDFQINDDFSIAAHGLGLVGQIMGFELQGMGSYQMWNEQFLKIGLEISSGSFTANSNDVSLSKTSLIVGYAKNF